MTKKRALNYCHHNSSLHYIICCTFWNHLMTSRAHAGRLIFSTYEQTCPSHEIRRLYKTYKIQVNGWFFERRDSMSTSWKNGWCEWLASTSKNAIEQPPSLISSLRKNINGFLKRNVPNSRSKQRLKERGNARCILRCSHENSLRWSLIASTMEIKHDPAAWWLTRDVEYTVLCTSGYREAPVKWAVRSRLDWTISVTDGWRKLYDSICCARDAHHSDLQSQTVSKQTLYLTHWGRNDSLTSEKDSVRWTRFLVFYLAVLFFI